MAKMSSRMRTLLFLLLATAATVASAQPVCTPVEPYLACISIDPREPADATAMDPCALPPELTLLRRYRELEQAHRLRGNASYYSGFFHGRKTANGEVFRNDRFSAAHLTLPLGTWVEVRARATKKALRLRVNDRGPYKGNFVIDLSQAAARELGVDRHPDREVEVRILALPGEEPPPTDREIAP